MNTPRYDDYLLRRVEALEAKRSGGLTFGRILLLGLVTVVLAVLALDFEPQLQVRRARIMAQEYCVSLKRDGAFLENKEQRQCIARLTRSILVGADMR